MRACFLVSLLASACYAPAYPDCFYTCGASGECPGSLTCSSGYCTADTGSCAGIVPDGAPDGALDVPNFSALDWSMAAKIDLVTPAGCEWAPVVSADLGTLIVNRPKQAVQTGDPASCLVNPVAEVYDWNDGTPTLRNALPNIEDDPITSNVRVRAIVPPPIASDPGLVGLVYNYPPAGDARFVLLDANLASGNGSPQDLNDVPARAQPAFDAAYSRIVFAEGGNLFETTGPLNGTLAQATPISTGLGGVEFSPALSPDGRVLVFAYQPPAPPDAPTELYVVRRADVTELWGDVAEIPAALFTGGFEFDPFIASNGDLLFSTTVDDGVLRHIYRARAKPETIITGG